MSGKEIRPVTDGSEEPEVIDYDQITAQEREEIIAFHERERRNLLTLLSALANVVANGVKK